MTSPYLDAVEAAEYLRYVKPGMDAVAHTRGMKAFYEFYRTNKQRMPAKRRGSRLLFLKTVLDGVLEDDVLVGAPRLVRGRTSC